jgi:hypothetical protein
LDSDLGIDKTEVIENGVLEMNLDSFVGEIGRVYLIEVILTLSESSGILYKLETSLSFIESPLYVNILGGNRTHTIGKDLLIEVEIKDLD